MESIPDFILLVMVFPGEGGMGEFLILFLLSNMLISSVVHAHAHARAHTLMFVKLPSTVIFRGVGVEW